MHKNSIKKYKFEKVEGEIVLTDIYFEERDYNFIHKLYNHVKRNDALYTRLIASIALTLFISGSPTLIFANPCGWISDMGNGAIGVVQVTVVKILTLGMILELGREGMRGGTHNMSSIITKFAILIAAVLFAPTFVQMLETFVKSYRP